MVRRFLKRIGALLLMFCICVGLIWTLKDISALYDNKNSASIESLHVFKKDEYAIAFFYNLCYNICVL